MARTKLLAASLVVALLVLGAGAADLAMRPSRGTAALHRLGPPRPERRSPSNAASLLRFLPTFPGAISQDSPPTPDLGTQALGGDALQPGLSTAWTWWRLSVPMASAMAWYRDHPPVGGLISAGGGSEDATGVTSESITITFTPDGAYSSRELVVTVAPLGTGSAAAVESQVLAELARSAGEHVPLSWAYVAYRLTVLGPAVHTLVGSLSNRSSVQALAGIFNRMYTSEGNRGGGAPSPVRMYLEFRPVPNSTSLIAVSEEVDGSGVGVSGPHGYYLQSLLDENHGLMRRLAGLIGVSNAQLGL